MLLPVTTDEMWMAKKSKPISALLAAVWLPPTDDNWNNIMKCNVEWSWKGARARLWVCVEWNDDKDDDDLV